MHDNHRENALYTRSCNPIHLERCVGPGRNPTEACMLLYKLGKRQARPLVLCKLTPTLEQAQSCNMYTDLTTHHVLMRAQKVEDVPRNKCTHIMYSFAGIDAKTFKLKSLGPETGEGSYEDFLRLRQLSPKSKLVLSVGGWGEGGQKYSDMSSSPAGRLSFIDSVIDTMDSYKEFDGFDLDWEYPGATDREGKYSDKDNFLRLIQELRQKLDEYADPGEPNGRKLGKYGRRIELSMAVPVAKFRLQEGYEVYELCQLMDFVNLMTYDLRGNWAGVGLNLNSSRANVFHIRSYANKTNCLNLKPNCM